MKMTAFSCRQDEMEFFQQFGKEYGVELELSRHRPTLENAHLLEGSQAACVITTPVDRALIDRWKQYGIKLISTRTVGFEHVDYEYAREQGITVTNADYSPDTVAEYTVMVSLMAVRKMKTIMTRYMGQDYSLSEIRGRELGRMTVGVVGTGRIGERVVRNLSGFGCRILAYDMYQKAGVKEFGEYVDLQRIWAECDLITFHTPASPETFHMVNAETLGKMKDGVVIVNMARGSVLDTPAFIDALESGKVGAAALDVVENEGSIYYRDFKGRTLGHREMAVLGAMPNVLMTPHTAFFTAEAVSDMVECAMKSCMRMEKGEVDVLQVN